MDNKPYKRVTISRPKDESLEAYKAWMMEITEKISTGPTTVKWTEDEWLAHWKEYWKERPSN